MKSMLSVEEVSKLIKDGKNLLLSGSEKVISKLPHGSWIAGTIPYFMTDAGGMISHSLIHATILPDEVSNTAVKTYSTDELSQIPQNYFQNGFSVIIIPAFSEAHHIYAKDCSTWPGLFNQPLVGWVSGIDLSDTSGSTPKVVNGRTGEIIRDKALVMHVQLKPGIIARANIINLFNQGSGDTISVATSGFEIDTCFINGKETQFSKYLLENKIDLQLPLVANYLGAMINVSIEKIDEVTKKVRLLAPVFPGVEYKIAKPVTDYESEFVAELKKHPAKPLFACNCVLNFMYAKLEGKKTGGIVGAMTFGEIAYMLLNQTLVYLTLE